LKRAPAGASSLVRVSVERGASATGLTSAGLKKRTERMLDALDLSGVEVSVALVGDPTIRELNRTWRK
jgi:ssRNA-specific RNase YbeY (16S rRNA maturation enzyme)